MPPPVKRPEGPGPAVAPLKGASDRQMKARLLDDDEVEQLEAAAQAEADLSELPPPPPPPPAF